MIKECAGDLLAADADGLVNTVNTVGVMGKGIALQFKRAYPEMFADYAKASKAGRVVRGSMHVWATGALTGPRFIINFPTKGHWRSPSRIEDIEAGLVDLVRVVKELGLRSVAVPPLGAGNGGLDWRDVEPLIRRAFTDLPEVEVLLYPPGATPRAAEMVRHQKVPTMTVGRAALVVALAGYARHALSASPIEVQKLMYFLQEAGEPLRLEYRKHFYGPYADNLRHVLDAVEGHFLTGFGDGSASVQEAEPLEVLPGAESAALDVLRTRLATTQRVERVLELAEGFESMYGLELLATVHWVQAHRADDPAGGEASRTLAEDVWRWSPRKRAMFSEEHINLASTTLRDRGWLPV